MSVETYTAKVLTPDDPRMPAVRRMVAQGYADLSRTPLAIDWVEAELLQDCYQDRASQIVVFNQDQIVGAARLLRGSDQPSANTQSLEAHDLMELNGQKPQPPFDRIGEVTRFTVHPAHRRHAAAITTEVWQGVCLEAQRLNLQQLFAIMPEYVTRICQAARISLQDLGGVPSQSDAARIIQERYPIYWEKKPHFYQFTDITPRQS